MAPSGAWIMDVGCSFTGRRGERQREGKRGVRTESRRVPKPLAAPNERHENRDTKV